MSLRSTTTHAKHRFRMHGTINPIVVSSLISGTWIELAFFHVSGVVFAVLLSLLFFVVSSGIFIATISRADMWSSSTFGIVGLRQQLAKCSLASIVFALYFPEYLARLQPPLLRSSLLLTIVLILWISLCTVSIRHQRGIFCSARTANLVGTITIVILFGLTTYIAIRKYYVFGYVGQDLAYFSQILHTTLNGHLFWGNLLQDLLYTRPVSTDFAGHNSPIMFLFLPFYAIFPSPVTLIVLRNSVLFACAMPIFLIARQRTTSPTAWVWVLAYLLTPSIFYQSTFDFYPLTFAALPVLFSLYFYSEQRYTAFCISLGLALLVREDLVFFVFGLGLLALMHRRPLRWAVMPLIAATGWAILSFAIVIPNALHGASFVTDTCFCHLGTTKSSMIHNVVFHPNHNLLLHDNVVYLKNLLTPTGVVLSFGSPLTFLAIPYLAINLLAGGGRCITNVIYAQYSLLPSTLLFVGSLHTLTQTRLKSFLTRVGQLGLRSHNVPSLLLLALSITGLVFNTGVSQFHELTSQTWTPEANRIITMIPESASVAAPRYMLPHLANRDCLYQTHRLREYHTIAYQYLIIDTQWKHINASQQYRNEYYDLVTYAEKRPGLLLIYSSPIYRVYKDVSMSNFRCNPQASHSN